jgi:DNA-binding SARP family transcriptional activator/Tol biopolymer transport system component
VLQFNTLGRLYVTRDGSRLAGAAAQPRRLALLAVLAAAGERGVSREKLMALLWPDTEEERARKGLNQALYALRQDLGSDEAIAGARDLRLDTEVVACDVVRFRQALARGEPERAIDEYAGPFLDGFHLAGAPEFERWADTERSALAREHATALERLARKADERGDHAAAIDWLRRLAAHDPLDARTAMRLMEALARAGDRTAALQHARVYELLVQQELDAPPDAQVVALAERIRRELAAATAETAAVDTATVSTATVDTATPAAAATPPAAAVEPEVVAVQPVAVSPVAVPKVAVARSRRLILLAGTAVVLVALVALRGTLRGPSASSVHLGSTHRLTLDPGLEVDVAPSPDGRVVAYAAGPEGDMRLYVRQVDGGRAVAVTTDLDSDERRPRWSPDGTHLLFQAKNGIWLVPSLGGVPRPVVEAPAGGKALFPAWSPDGKSLAWVHGDTILARALEDGPARRVAVLHEPHSLTWSPDGRWIAAVSGNTEFLYGAVYMLPGQTSIGNAAPSTIWLVPAAGGGAPVRVTEGEHLHTSPDWRGPGQLLFVSDRDGSRDVFVVGVGDDGRPTGDPERLTTGLGLLSLGTSADGRALAYVSFTQRVNVWSLALGAGAPVGTAAARPVTTGTQVVEAMDVSPDGRWLAFDAERSGHQQIFRVRTDCAHGDSLGACEEPERIVEADESSFRPSWAPDGRTIVFYAFENGVRHAFSASADGAAPHPLLPAAWGEVHTPVLAPDGRRLTFHRDLASGSQLFESVRAGDSTWSRPRQLTRRGGWGARRSPDGARLVYLAPNEVRLMGAAGEDDSRPLWRAGGAANLPQPVWLRWAPDGRSLLVKAFDARGAGTLWSLPADCTPTGDAGCGPPRLLVRFDDPLRPTRRPEFATDGAHVYFTLAERESDLWLVRLR